MGLGARPHWPGHGGGDNNITTSAGAVDREFVNIHWPQLSPNFAGGFNLDQDYINWMPLAPLGPEVELASWEQKL